MKIGSIVIHCHDFDRTVGRRRFITCRASRRKTAGWFSVTQRTKVPICHSRVAIGVHAAGVGFISTSTPGTSRPKVERLVALGARRYPWRYRAGDDFVVLEDPGGALFCVVQKADVPRN
jgi:hypothetical protein